MENDYHKIAELSNPIEAEILTQMLNQNSINAICMNKRDSSYLVFGVIEIYCQSKDVIAALHLINNIKNNEK